MHGNFTASKTFSYAGVAQVICIEKRLNTPVPLLYKFK